MLSPFRQLRASVSALLLMLQVLGLAHLALVSHTLSDTGALVDTAGLATEAHRGRAHVCADPVRLEAGGDDDCVVLATFSSPSLLARVELSSRSREQACSNEGEPAFIAAQLDVLSRAPKASPPQG